MYGLVSFVAEVSDKPLILPMPKHDYIFVDESGDAGYKLDPATGELLSSNYYIAAALHLTDDAFRVLNEHMAAFRFYSRFNRELKIPSQKSEFTTLLDPIRVLSEGGKHIWASAVYVDKLEYAGSYLKPGGKRPASSVLFRNYILRRLLEHHFHRFPLQSRQYDLVLDRVDQTRQEYENLWRYIYHNRNFPTPTHITHASSVYVEALQVVHHIANGLKDITSGGLVPNELSFANLRDLTADPRTMG